MANVRGNKPVVEKIVPSSGWTQDSNGHFLHVYLPEFKKEQVQIQINNISGHVRVSGERTTNQNKQVRFDESYKVPAEKLNWDKITARFDGEFLHVNLPKQVDTVVEKKRVDDEKQVDTVVEKKRVDDEKQVETEVEKQRDETSTTTSSTATMEKQKDVVDGNGGGAEEQTQQKPHGEEEVKRSDEGGHGGQIKKEEKVGGGERCRRLPEASIVKKHLEEEEGYMRSAMKKLSQSKEIIVTAILALSLGVLLSRSFQSPARH